MSKVAVSKLPMVGAMFRATKIVTTALGESASNFVTGVIEPRLRRRRDDLPTGLRGHPGDAAHKPAEPPHMRREVVGPISELSGPEAAT
ncbi:hypothetical protein ACFW08_19510 [Streptomyces sp. NPDC058960]|uniref:hypothetical protein n=1 Tax=Streptomyces sp. NPDC058960 TaxID=3346679 RepID=UPI0036B695B5